MRRSGALTNQAERSAAGKGPVDRVSHETTMKSNDSGPEKAIDRTAQTDSMKLQPHAAVESDNQFADVTTTVAVAHRDGAVVETNVWIGEDYQHVTDTTEFGRGGAAESETVEAFA